MKSGSVNPLELSEAEAWSGSYQGTPTLLDFIGMRVGLAGALAVGKMLRPELVEQRGCVILRERFEQSNFDDWWQQLDGDIPGIEAVINHIHLWDIFNESGDDDDLVAAALDELARIIASSWRSLLDETYPGRFNVNVEVGEDSGYGPTVSFSSKLM